MELKSEEIDSLKNLLDSWLLNNNQELEATFGEKGQVDSSRFLAVAQRLKGKGFTAIPQDEYLTISLQNNLRFTIQGMEMIEDYCRNEDIQGKGAIVMIKDKVGTEEDRDSKKLKEYDVKVKLRRELPLDMEDARVKAAITGWGQQAKYFRLIRRWSFEGLGCRFDLSMVRSTIKDERGIWKRITSFQQQNVPAAPPTYEIEVELVRSAETTVNRDQALSVFIRGLGEILRGLQRCSLLIRNSVKAKVLAEYEEVVKTNRFRGVNPVTLERKDMEPGVARGDNIRFGSYNVTDKADGLRAMGFCTGKGELFLIDMAMNVYRTDLKREECKHSLVDGEWITQNKKGEAVNQFLLFDIYVATGGADVSQKNFWVYGSEDGGRYFELKEWMKKWDANAPSKAPPLNSLRVSLKTFLFNPPNNEGGIFPKCAQMLDKVSPYNTDGLIITDNISFLPEQPGIRFNKQFKWKPPKDNTIDFLVKYVKDKDDPKADKLEEVIKPGTLETIKYKTLRLYVGSSTDPAYNDPRYTILYQRPLPSGRPGWKKGKKSFTMKPVLFNPKENSDPFASVCNLQAIEDLGTKEFYVSTEIHVDENGRQSGGDPIQDNSIVEMRYDITAEPGWNWIPVRIRYDKTERLLQGTIQRTLNSDETAESVWNSIHMPVTEHMIRTGSAAPSTEEREQLMALVQSKAPITKQYYHRDPYAKNIEIAKNLRAFHNIYIKENILIKPAVQAGGKTVWDMSVGQGGDLRKYSEAGCTMMLGSDVAGEGIRDPVSGAYRRYMNLLVSVSSYYRETIPPMLFIVADSSKPYRNGVAGVDTEEANMLKAVLGEEPSERVAPYVERIWKGKYKTGVDLMSCMFSLHYFFQDYTTWEGFKNNIRDNLKVGGYFICCYTDGNVIYNLLRNVDKGEEIVGTLADNRVLYRIEKQYDLMEDTLPETVEAGFGHAYEVEFATIGAKHREYLVPFQLLIDQMNSIGCRLLDNQDKAAFGIPPNKPSTALFADTYNNLMNSNMVGLINNYKMEKAEQEYSFTNRWCIFRRYGRGISDVLIERPTIKEEEVKYAATSPIYASSKTPNYSAALGQTGPVYNPTSPVYNPSSPVYNPTSPVYKPEPTGIQYAATSPEYKPAPTGIQYAPTSPVFSPEPTGIQYPPTSPEYKPEPTGVQYAATSPIYQPYTPVLGAQDATTTQVPELGSPTGILAPAKSPGEVVNNNNTPPPHPYNFDNNTVQGWATRTALDQTSTAWQSIPYSGSVQQDAGIRQTIEGDKTPKINALEMYYDTYYKNLEGEPDESNNYIRALERAEAQIKQQQGQNGNQTGNQTENQTGNQTGNQNEAANKEGLVTPVVKGGVRTIPVEKGIAAGKQKKYPAHQIFRFFGRAEVKDSLKIEDPGAARWLALSAPFPIEDKETKIKYPSVNHYLAAMKYKLATDKPEIAENLLSSTGTIHSKYLRQREQVAKHHKAGKDKAEVSEQEDSEMLRAEAAEVAEAALEKTIKRYRATFDEAKWVVAKDKVLEEALQQRWDHDARFHKIVEAARKQQKYLLYYNGTSTVSNFGGIYRKDGTIEGENLVGYLIMKIAKFPGLE